MLGVYWQLLVALWHIRSERTKGYARVYLGKYCWCGEIYPKTKELLKKRGYTLFEHVVLPNDDKPAYWISREYKYVCSVCNCFAGEEYDYCPHCGSLMQKE